MSARDEALRYAAADMHIFPVNAAKRPLTPHGFKDASSDPEVIKAWLQKWPYCDFGWPCRRTVVVVDIDMKRRQERLRRLQAPRRMRSTRGPNAASQQRPRAGCTSSLRRQEPTRTRSAIAGTGIDTRSLGGYVVLPRRATAASGCAPSLAPTASWSRWPKRRRGSTPRCKKPSRAAVGLAPQAALVQATSIPTPGRRRRRARSSSVHAPRSPPRPPGAQDATRHAQCYLVGGFIGRGDLGYEEGFAALLAAALAMPAYADPWHNLETRVARSIEAGMAAPLPLSETEAWVRNFRARMRLMRPGARHG